MKKNNKTQNIAEIEALVQTLANMRMYGVEMAPDADDAMYALNTLIIYARELTGQHIYH